MANKHYSKKELKERFCKWSNVELKYELEDMDKLVLKNKAIDENLEWKNMLEQEIERRKEEKQKMNS